jgi:hypothetical protein
VTLIANDFEAHVYPYQDSVPYSASAASGTYQATGDAIGSLHRFVFGGDVRILAGTGASVTATAGELWKAGVPYYWVPTNGRESLSWTETTSTSVVATAAIVQSARTYRR